MPELPDVVLYIERLRSHLVGQTLVGLRLTSPFVLRTVNPPVSTLINQPLTGVERLGKQIVLCFPQDRFAVIHLMISGRLRLRSGRAKRTTPNAVCILDFPDCSLIFTEASKKKRASIHLCEGRDALASFRRHGLSILDCTRDSFIARLHGVRHTVKRALRDPDLIDGIGNAYSDEILHRAKLSPIAMVYKLSDDQLGTLWQAAHDTLRHWIALLDDELGDGFPDKVTAFHPNMAVHGRYRQPCPTCESPVQRIVYAQNETNYCATCQTDGVVLRDRALSTLLRRDWPKTIDAWESLRSANTDKS